MDEFDEIQWSGDLEPRRSEPVKSSSEWPVAAVIIAGMALTAFWLWLNHH